MFASNLMLNFWAWCSFITVTSFGAGFHLKINRHYTSALKAKVDRNHSNEKFDRVVDLVANLAIEINSISQQMNNLSMSTNEQMHNLSMSTNQRITKTSKQIQQLTGHNQNQDLHLEYNIGRAFSSYLINEMNVPEECIFEYTTTGGVIYDPKSGDVASEWDSIFLVDFTNFPEDNRKEMGPACPQAT